MSNTQIATFSGSLLLAAVMEPKEIGKRIKTARKRKHWTQLTFALEANVSPSTVARWERGELPRVHELMRIAELLDVGPEQLVELEPTEETQIVLLRGEVGELREMVAELLGRSG